MILIKHFSIRTVFLIIFISNYFFLPVYSQTNIKGIIIDKETKFPLPFASVVYQTSTNQKGVISDVNGIFEIADKNVNSIKISFLGYETMEIFVSTVNDLTNIQVELETNSQEINEIVVTPENNPAIKIIKKTLENKDLNNYINYEKYNYVCYFKTILDIKLSNDEALKDSSITNQKFLNQASFISECVMSCLSVNKKTEYKIIAQKTSGFKDPIIVQSYTSMFHNSISFYNNIIPLFETPLDDNTVTDFVSPLSDGCLNSYCFFLENSYVIENDTIFVINFYPKKNKNFNSLKGQLFISSNKYAIKSIVVEPYEKGLINFKFKQDYEYVDNKWFPTNLDEEIGWASKKISKKINAYPVYIITSKIDSINFNPDTVQSQISLEKVYIDELSIVKSDSILNKYRNDSLTLREKNTFQYFDSISNVHNFEYIIKFLPKLVENKISINIFDLDISNIYIQNKYEKNRFGICLYTNEKLIKNVTLGGFAAYGTNDKKIKYGGIIILDFDKYNEIQFKVSYQNNLMEVGTDNSTFFLKQSTNEYLRSNLCYRFDKCTEKKVEFGFRALRFFKITTSLSLRNLEPTYEYFFNDILLTSYHSDEFQISGRFAYNEVLTKLGNQRIVDFKGNPIINLTYKKGINIFEKHSFQYNRIEASLEFTLYGGRIGQSNFYLTSGYIDENLPYGLLFTGEGSKSLNSLFIINHSFQTMSPYEFLSDKYINLFYSHNFGSLLFKTEKFKPQFIIAQNSGFGKLENNLIQGIDFKEKDKIFLETGLIIKNIIKLKYMDMIYLGLGGGFFYRYGYYSFENYKDNLAFKISATITIN